MIILMAASTCGTDSSARRAADGDEATRDSVRAFIEAIPPGLASDGPNAWLRFFEDSSSFFMASDGRILFPGRDSAEIFLEVFAITVAAMDLEWEDIRIEPLAPGAAVIAAAYREAITSNDGTVSTFGGFVTGVARSRSGEWKLQHLHWSSPVPAEE